MRICRWCRLQLDDKARPGSEMVKTPKGEPRKTQAHCPSPSCDWCKPCELKRLVEFGQKAAGQ